ncbi:DUF3884 family protein, partial [Streptococcus pyogenes]
FKKIYILSFESEPDLSILSEQELASLGKWFKHSGSKWICHSVDTMEEFQRKFLEMSGLKASDLIMMVDHWPFKLFSP